MRIFAKDRENGRPFQPTICAGARSVHLPRSRRQEGWRLCDPAPSVRSAPPEISLLRDPQRICDYLIDAANRNGGDDNITMVVVQVIGSRWSPLLDLLENGTVGRIRCRG